MAGPSDSQIRNPAVAGAFYPEEPERCRAEATGYLQVSAETASENPHWLGAVVPHAGWAYSGAVAGEVIATLAAQGQVDVVVVFGAMHSRYPAELGVLDSHRAWQLPTGLAELPGDLSRQLAEQTNFYAVDERPHQREHAIEVEVPLIQLAWPGTALLPIEVPPCGRAVEIGRQTARTLSAAGVKAIYLASSDLTHYGRQYGFAPAGLSLGALQWAKENDRRLLRLVTELDADRVVPETSSRLNACGGGAIAALLGAVKEMGAARGKVVRHVHSFDRDAAAGAKHLELSVGYAGIVVG